MASSLNPVTTTVTGSRPDPYLSELGRANALSVTLDQSTFAAADYSTGMVGAGFPLGKITASGMFGPYDPDGSDGRETLAGLLAWDVSMSSTDVDRPAAMCTHAIVDESALPVPAAPNGAIDADAKADVPTITYQ